MVQISFLQKINLERRTIGLVVSPYISTVSAEQERETTQWWEKLCQRRR
jgi:hypothetical protein